MKKKVYEVDRHPAKPRAYTVPVGTPIVPRRNDGREATAQLGSLQPTIKRGCAGMCPVSNMYDKLAPYASNEPVRVAHRAPSELSPKERKAWHWLKKRGLI
jgi:hypothetical protein